MTSARPQTAVELEIEHKNIAEAELLVYRVDLLTLYLREKNLSSITSVNLAGISPTLRLNVELSGEADWKPATHTVRLPLDTPGAYLVICRGDELFTSGLVLVSSLELSVREDPVSGRLRVQRGQETHEYVTAVGPEELWRLVTHHRDRSRGRPWVYREDVL